MTQHQQRRLDGKRSGRRGVFSEPGFRINPDGVVTVDAQPGDLSAGFNGIVVGRPGGLLEQLNAVDEANR